MNTSMKIGTVKISRTSAIHYCKLIFRSCLFLAAAASYAFDRLDPPSEGSLSGGVARPWVMATVWIIFASEMTLRFFPDRNESMGCQKVFGRNYKPSPAPAPAPDYRRSLLAIALAWTALNGAIAALYFTHVIDRGALLLVSLFYGVCDMVCILFFCPFETWFLKNKCCGTCRIYNWDYLMMFTPLIFIPSFATWSLVALALGLFAKWEITFRTHPERFHEETNLALTCRECTEKLCAHKKQLRSFHRKMVRQALGRVETASSRIQERMDRDEARDAAMNPGRDEKTLR